MYGKVEKKAIFQAVSAMGIYRVPMEAAGYIFDKGYIFVVEDDYEVSQVREIILRIWQAQEVKSKKDVEKICNYQIGIHCYQKYDSIREVSEFLQEKNFLPILLVAGVLPEELIDHGYAFHVTDGVEQISGMSEEYRRLTELVDLVEMLQYEVKNTKNETSCKDMCDNKFEWIQKIFSATAEIWATIYKDEFADSEIADWKKSYCRELSRQLGQMEELYDIAEVEELVKCYIGEYLQRHSQIKFAYVKNPICKGNEIVLYDDEALYFPEKMLKEACEPIKQSISFLQLKRDMESSGMLICNATEKRNFTVKKSIFNSEEGEIIRVRFVKIAREKLRLPDGMDLVDFQEMEEEDEVRNI